MTVTGPDSLSHDCTERRTIACRIAAFSAHRLAAWSAIAACAMALSGCSQLKEQLPPPLFGLSLFGDTPDSAATISDTTQLADGRAHSRESLTVLVHPAQGTKQRMQIGYQPGMTVQGLLNETGLTKRFVRMDLELKRRTTEVNRVIPLPVTYENKKRAVAPATDYSLHPGDILVVTQSENTVVDDVLTKVAGPLLKRYKKRK